MADDRDKANGGFALVAVLGFLLVISAVLLPYSISARLRALTTVNAMRSFEDQQLAATLATYVASQLSSPPGQPIPRAVEAGTPCMWGKTALELRAQSHAGLIDLNAAGIDLLEIGFQSLGFSGETSKTLAFGVTQYRRLDRTIVSGLSQPQLTPEGLKHAAFEDIVELHDFLALRTISTARLANTFTVHTQNGTLAVDFASQELRRVISAMTGRVMPFLVETTGAGRATTVVVTIRRGEDLEYVYAATFRTGASGPTFESNLPGLEGVEAVIELPGRPLSCPSILGPELVQVIGEIIQ
ncbi:MAG: hypothetical protein ACK4P4_01165 [Allorhizobium sp.]